MLRYWLEQARHAVMSNRCCAARKEETPRGPTQGLSNSPDGIRCTRNAGLVPSSCHQQFNNAPVPSGFRPQAKGRSRKLRFIWSCFPGALLSPHIFLTPVGTKIPRWHFLITQDARPVVRRGAPFPQPPTSPSLRETLRPQTRRVSSFALHPVLKAASPILSTGAVSIFCFDCALPLR
jgi:hypothetical protein